MIQRQAQARAAGLLSQLTHGRNLRSHFGDPDWFVQHGKDAHRSDVRVINPKMTSLFVDAGARPRLQVAQRNRIVHALHKKFPEIGE